MSYYTDLEDSACQALTFLRSPFILQIKEVLPANGRAPRNYLQEVTAGLLCRAVTSFCY